ncbi:MAG: S9 family peptidase, partial [candidate division Zixibacteria bacterium]|nr:S9 family peptidase [candidate division Zixibacteria bacterium]
MEDPESEETINWVNAQNKITADFVDTPIREKIKDRYTKLYNYPKFSLPHKEGDFYVYKKNDGLQAQYVMYKQDKLGGESKVILDPNKLSDDGTISLNYYSFTKDGSLMGYGLSEKGSDWQTIHFLNIETGEKLDDVIQFTRFVTPAWKHDNSGFYYDSYPDPSTVPAGEETYYNKLYWHTLGTDQSEDLLIYERPDDNRLGFGTGVTEDGKYLIIYVWRGTDRENGIYYLKIDGNNEVIRLLDDFDASYSLIDN